MIAVRAVNQIGWSTPIQSNPLSWLIKKVTKSKASHVWFLVWDKDWEIEMVMEAHELGFRYVTLEQFKRMNNIVAVYMPTVDLDPGIKWAATWLGTGYDFAGLFGMAVVVLGRILKKKFSNPLQNSHAMFCSEMTVSVLRLVKQPGIEALEPSTTTPQDLMDFLLPEKPDAT